MNQIKIDKKKYINIKLSRSDYDYLMEETDSAKYLIKTIALKDTNILLTIEFRFNKGIFSYINFKSDKFQRKIYLTKGIMELWTTFDLEINNIIYCVRFDFDIDLKEKNNLRSIEYTSQMNIKDKHSWKSAISKLYDLIAISRFSNEAELQEACGIYFGFYNNIVLFNKIVLDDEELIVLDDEELTLLQEETEQFLINKLKYFGYDEFYYLHELNENTDNSLFKILKIFKMYK